ncbi:MAG: hypothetical protein WC343_01315 [Bacilli bacterium]|jgi:hypothetical protein
MHSEYITTCCITDERYKLLLLKYAETDITNISKFVKPITLELMNQCYNHLELLHNDNKERNKKYYKIEENITEQLKDLMFIKEKFDEYFSKPGVKTKEDLFIYIFAFKINNHYYSNYLYSILVKLIKNNLTDDFLKKHSLNDYEISNLELPD